MGQLLARLVNEMRIVMYPYTAINLKESSANSIKDFLLPVDIYGFSHMMMFTNTEKNSYLRFAKMPAGPTITFKIKDYCLSNDIYESQTRDKRPLTKNFDHIPLIIMNGFNSADIKEEYDTALKTVSMMFQSFFPPLNLTEIQIKKCKRVVMVNLKLNDKGEPLLLFRHYDLHIEKYSSKKTIANLISSTSMNRDLSQFDNIADYVLRASGFTSQSENDDPNLGQCEIIADTNSKEEKIKVKLIEIGPRLNLQIYKIEEGFLKGNVAYHSLIKKSKKEIQEMMNELKEKRKLKKERQIKQKINIKEKQQKKIEQPNEEETSNKETRKTRNEFLNKKTARPSAKRSKKEKVNEKKRNKEMVMTKRSLKQFKNLKRFK